MPQLDVQIPEEQREAWHFAQEVSTVASVFAATCAVQVGILLQRERQLRRLVHTAFDVVVPVDISSGRARFTEQPLWPNHESQLSTMLGGYPPEYFEELLTPKDVEQWGAYLKEECQTQDGTPASASSPRMVQVRLRNSSTEVPGRLHSAVISVCGASGGSALLGLRALPVEARRHSCSHVAEQQKTQSLAATSSCSASLVDNRRNSSKTTCHGEAAGRSLSCEAIASVAAVGDCLPPWGRVWAEGVSSPVTLEDVKPGMRVLTVDDSSQPPCVAFAPVRRVSASADSDDVPWVRVRLADGSESVVTASHPVWPHKSSDNGGKLGALRAVDLVPGVDSLVVLAPRPVMVKNVRPVPREDAPRTRVEIELGWDSTSPAQPSSTDGVAGALSRRALMVLSGSSAHSPSSESSWIAVGDSKTKPALNRFDATIEDIDQDNCSQSTSQTSQSGSRTTGSSCSRSQPLPSHVSSAAKLSTSYESESSADENAVVYVGGHDEKSSWKHSALSDTWERSQDLKCDMGRKVKLSDVSALPRGPNGGHLSFGSIGHITNNDTCKVCVFYRKNGANCRHSWLCTFCHASHLPYARPRRPDKRRFRPGELAFEGSRGPEDDGADDRSSNTSGATRSSGATRTTTGSSARGLMGTTASRQHPPPAVVEPWYVDIAQISNGNSAGASASASTGRFLV